MNVCMYHRSETLQYFNKLLLFIQNSKIKYAFSSFLRSFVDFPLGSGVQCDIFL